MFTKVMTIVGTRPEIIKLSRVIAELDKTVEHIIVHTGQNYDFELNEVFFNDLGVRRPNYFLDAVGATTAETIGNIITKSDAILEKENPEIVAQVLGISKLFSCQQGLIQFLCMPGTDYINRRCRPVIYFAHSSGKFANRRCR